MKHILENQFQQQTKHHDVNYEPITGISQLDDLKALFKALTIFDPISLGEMDDAKLMDRTDIKFIFENAQHIVN